MITLPPLDRFIEDVPLVTGEGQFLADLVDDGVLHCAFARSTVAHGIVTGCDTTAAREAPGVVAVYESAAELGLKDLPSAPGGGGAPEAAGMTRPPFASERVRYVGEAVCVVVAETAGEAAEAAALVVLTIEPLPVVGSAEDGLKDSSLLFPGAGTNLVHRTGVTQGDPAAGEYDIVVSVDVASPRMSHVAIETLGFLAKPVGDGLEVWCGHQAPGRLPRQIGGLLGIPPESVRARSPLVGGAFGTKSQLYPEYPIVASVARQLGRPAVWLQSRRESILNGTHGRGQHNRVELSGDKSGRIRRGRFEILAEIGAYPLYGSRVPLYTQLVATGLYDIEHVAIDTTMVVTNRPPIGALRGAGRPEAALGIERAVDAFAAAAGRDPAEVRRLNFIPKESLPYKTATGALYDSGDYAQALEMALDAVDVPAFRAEQAERRAAGQDPIGLGICAFVERTGGGVGSGEFGRVDISPSGEVIVRSGSMSTGVGHQTVWRQLASSVLTVAPKDVRVIEGDTGEVPNSVGSFASRSAQMGGTAVWECAQHVRDQARTKAAEMLEIAEGDLSLDAGVFRVNGSPAIEVSLGEIAAAIQEDGGELAFEEFFNPESQTFPYGVYVAVVGVELDTGSISIDRLVCVDDVGTVLNPMIVEGQIHGSVMMGLGQALLEEVRYDDDGQPLNPTLLDYLVAPALLEVPIETLHLSHPAPSIPTGVKGAGESGCIGVPPAMLNAVYDALEPYGVTDLSMPLTPEKVWTAIQDARPGRNVE
jgi:carbon-monoxide dehydrogenase large subunit